MAQIAENEADKLVRSTKHWSSCFEEYLLEKVEKLSTRLVENQAVGPFVMAFNVPDWTRFIPMLVLSGRFMLFGALIAWIALDRIEYSKLAEEVVRVLGEIQHGLDSSEAKHESESTNALIDGSGTASQKCIMFALSFFLMWKSVLLANKFYLNVLSKSKFFVNSKDELLLESFQFGVIDLIVEQFMDLVGLCCNVAIVFFCSREPVDMIINVIAVDYIIESDEYVKHGIFFPRNYQTVIVCAARILRAEYWADTGKAVKECLDELRLRHAPPEAIDEMQKVYDEIKDALERADREVKSSGAPQDAKAFNELLLLGISGSLIIFGLCVAVLGMVYLTPVFPHVITLNDLVDVVFRKLAL